MKIIFLTLMVAFSTSCRSPQQGEDFSEKRSNPSSKAILTSSVDNEHAIRILWQRSYPDEYAKLIEYAESSRNGEGDPFSTPITIPNRNLTPSELDWDRAIIPRAFQQLGWPLTNGAKAIYHPDTGVIEITHKPEAIASFRERFPEFTSIIK